MTDLLIYDPSQFEHVYVRDQDALVDVARRLDGADALGVDVEMGQRVERRAGGLQEWVHTLALIQIASERVSVVIDPLRCRDLAYLRPIMAGPARKVFLGGGQDAALLERAGIPARRIVDVGEIALGVFGRREDGMAALAHRIFGISLDKTVRRTDWLVRPLDHTLIHYAHRDAELTLLIYRWFQQHFPEATSLHERLEIDARLPDGIAPWIRAGFARTSPDILAIVMEHGFEPRRDAERLSLDVRMALRTVGAPRAMNRLIRIASELGLSALVPDILPYTTSRSSLLRSSSARALGVIGTPETVEDTLLRLKEDPIGDVKTAAEVALRDLRRPAPEMAGAEEEEPEPSLSASSMSALQKLMESMQADEG